MSAEPRAPRALGRSGMVVSPLCLGAMNFGMPTDVDTSKRIIAAALDAGITMIDVADVYNAGESERITGAALRELGHRDDVVLATKVGAGRGHDGAPGGSRRHILRSCDESLARLGTDRIDLYQLHRPWVDVPPEETLGAFDELVRAGKVRAVGCSTHPAWMLMEALATSARLAITSYVSEQPPYNLLDRRIENELVPLCRRYDLAVFPWSPIAGGILAGRYGTTAVAVPTGSRAERHAGLRERVNPRAVEVAGEVARLAAARGLTPGQLALLWAKDQPGITAPIVGPRTVEQLEEMLPVLDLTLDEETAAALDALVHPGNAVADFHNTSGWMRARVTG